MTRLVEFLKALFHRHQWVAADVAPEELPFAKSSGARPYSVRNPLYYRNWACVTCGRVDLQLDRRIRESELAKQRTAQANATVTAALEREVEDASL